MSLDEAARTELRERVRSRLPFGTDGSIELSSRAWGRAASTVEHVWNESTRVESKASLKEGSMSANERETATLAGGCFWCLEAVFEQLEGVEIVVSGYTGGQVKAPSYEQVCSGATGHAEAIQITYDPTVISYRELLELFFAFHDPTTMNRQGHDAGTQYRSAIFYATREQRRRRTR